MEATKRASDEPVDERPAKRGKTEAEGNGVENGGAAAVKTESDSKGAGVKPEASTSASKTTTTTTVIKKLPKSGTTTGGKKTVTKVVKKLVPKTARTKQLEAEVASLQKTIKSWQDVSNAAGGCKTPQKLREFLQTLQESSRALKDQFREAKKRESELVVRLTQKEKDIYNLEAQQKELTEITNKKTLQMRTTFMDPLINENFRHMQEVVDQSKKKLEKAEDDLKAVKFDPSAITGRELIAKCRKLQEENEDAFKQLASSQSVRVAAQLKAQQATVNEQTKELEENYEFLLQLDTELESLQDKVFGCEQTISKLEKENRQLRDLEEDNNVLQDRCEEMRAEVQALKDQLAAASSSAADSSSSSSSSDDSSSSKGDSASTSPDRKSPQE